MSCTNKQCPLRDLCEKGQNEGLKGEYFEYKTLKGHDYLGNLRPTYSCDAFEKKKDVHQICDELYGKIEPIERLIQ